MGSKGPGCVSLDSCTDEEIVARVVAGELGLFEVIVRRHGTRLYRVALSVLRDEADAEDVVQDTYVSAYQHLAQFAGRARFLTWLTRIALYKALARASSRGREVPFESDPPQDQCRWLAASGPTPEQGVARMETAVLLHAAIRALPDNYRQVLILRDLRDMGTSETAEHLRISETNVKVRLHRARAMLRREYAHLHGSPLVSPGEARSDRSGPASEGPA